MDPLPIPQIFSARSSSNALTTKRAENPNCSADEALRYAALLLGCYRKVDCADPEVFATAAVAVFSRYPADVVSQVTDPHNGIPATSKWVPTIHEIREACETVSAAKKRQIEQFVRVKAQFAERDRLAGMDSAERRQEFIAKWRGRMAMMEAQAVESDVKLDEMDARNLNGKHAELVKQALDAKLKRLTEHSHSNLLKLSPAAMATVAGRGTGVVDSKENVA